jgi:hypothetical protein
MDVLEDGSIPNALLPVFNKLARSSTEFRKAFGLAIDDPDMVGLISEQALTSLRRLLGRIQGYGHGGAVLITPSIRAAQLSIKHQINYPRLARAIQKVCVLERRSNELYDEVIEIAQDLTEDSLPISLHLNDAVINNELENARSELEGSLWFASLLSRIDGLVLMDQTLTIKGFGVEISVAKKPEEVWLAGDIEASKNARTRLPYEHYGTRHRSMMRYIARVPGSVGFVVSQDRGVRAITTINSDLVMWDNVQLQQDFSLYGTRDLSADGEETADSASGV